QAPGYGLGLMIESTVPPSFLGHTGQGPSSTGAVYHFPAWARSVTAAAFAPVDDQGRIEQCVVDIAQDIVGDGREAAPGAVRE
ncbi:MAG: hypothetical protein ACXU87_19605, partial [Xanthobacteraceae bacterium]